MMKHTKYKNVIKQIMILAIYFRLQVFRNLLKGINRLPRVSFVIKKYFYLIILKGLYF